MNRNSDILFTTEYLKGILYFATVRDGRILKSTADTHYFCIDDELVYENYYSDFGPLNLGCVHKYCKIVNEKLKQYMNKVTLVHYTSIEPRKKANSAFLIACYGVLCMNLQPRDALKPLTIHGQSYRPFQDATQGTSPYTISLMDCLQAILKAKTLGFFNFQDFNYEEYDRMDKIQGGDLNWIVPGKFLAFVGPVDYSVAQYHPPDLYIDYFLENNVKIVMRLNKKLYDGNVFNNMGITHYDLFFPDGSCPPRHILIKFLQIAEECDGAIAVHCKAGLGRTGSLIACYMMKHYRMSSHEAIGWLRICRPGSVIGQQQAWLEQLEAWLIKQGNIYRHRMYGDIEKLPYHEFGVYSITEKAMSQSTLVSCKSSSPSMSNKRHVRSDTMSPGRPQTSKQTSNKAKKESNEQWRVRPIKVISPKVYQQNRKERTEPSGSIPRQVSGAGDPRATESPIRRSSTQARPQSPTKRVTAKQSNSSNIPHSYDPGLKIRKATISPVKNDHESRISSYNKSKLESRSRQYHECRDYDSPITTFRTSNGPVIKTVNDARKFLLKSSMYNQERSKQLLSSVTVTSHSFANQSPNFTSVGITNPPRHAMPSYYSTATKGPTQPQQRRRLGRSPSPLQTIVTDHTRARATNTPPSSVVGRRSVKDSKTTLKEALSKLKIQSPRNGAVDTASLGAASLGARRDSPTPKRAPSVRSDERTMATQGDLLNSIKFQRRLRNSILADKVNERTSSGKRYWPPQAKSSDSSASKY